jgi:uncharacterized protein
MLCPANNTKINTTNMTILIAGGTGLIGTQLTKMAQEAGHEVRILTRKATQAGQYAWDPTKGTMDDSALEGVQVVINLAGAGIADGRWTVARKKLLIESRTQTADTLLAAFQRTKKYPDVYIGASAIGYYGNTGEALVTESKPPVSNDFMVQCCQAWEQATARIAELGIRTVTLRIGVVLALEGGALREFVRPLRLGVGGYFGAGQAWYSWIHRDDMCRMILWAAQNDRIVGVYNAVTPNAVRIKPLVKAIGKAMGAWALYLPAPEFVLQLALGEMSAVVLNSNLVSAQKVLDAGFEFTYPEVDGALSAIFQR